MVSIRSSLSDVSEPAWAECRQYEQSGKQGCSLFPEDSAKNPTRTFVTTTWWIDEPSGFRMTRVPYPCSFSSKDLDEDRNSVV